MDNNLIPYPNSLQKVGKQPWHYGRKMFAVGYAAGLKHSGEAWSYTGTSSQYAAGIGRRLAALFDEGYHAGVKTLVARGEIESYEFASREHLKSIFDHASEGYDFDAPRRRSANGITAIELGANHVRKVQK